MCGSGDSDRTSRPGESRAPLRVAARRRPTISALAFHTASAQNRARGRAVASGSVAQLSCPDATSCGVVSGWACTTAAGAAGGATGSNMLYARASYVPGGGPYAIVGTGAGGPQTGHAGPDQGGAYGRYAVGASCHEGMGAGAPIIMLCQASGCIGTIRGMPDTGWGRAACSRGAGGGGARTYNGWPYASYAVTVSYVAPSAAAPWAPAYGCPKREVAIITPRMRWGQLR